MRLNTVIAVATLNAYVECVPYFIQAWQRCCPDVVVHVVLLGGRIPDFLQPWADFIHLLPLASLPPTVGREEAARQLRYVYPPYYHGISPRVQQGLSDVVLVANIDVIPLNPGPFLKAAELYPEDIFLQLLDTDNPETLSTFPAKYTMATTATWRELYGISPRASWSWEEATVGFQLSLRERLLDSSLYPTRIRVVGSGRIDYDPSVSDCTLRLPLAAFGVPDLVLRAIEGDFISPS